jgi:eukaryotic-like serine/threonine-protein kinase
MALASGTRLGPYEIISPIGAGGMGDVYRARDTRLERTVAIKVLPALLSSDQRLRQRFEQEARAISSLNHPHICTLHDVGTQDGVSFLVMEYLDGETLSHRLQKGSLPMEQALKIGTEIADALEKANSRGIIHRDLKPGNIMLTKSGAKLMDFGLAKPVQVVMESAPNVTPPTVSNALTAEGTIVGTLQYMSPEQLEGKEADARSDIFALGTVLYEMFTGRQAFTGKSRASVIAAILTSEPPPISQLQPLSPPILDHVIKRALAKDPDERWQTAHDLASELHWIRGSASQLTSAPDSASRPKWRELMAWAIAALCLAAAILMLRPSPSIRTDLVRFQIPAPEGVNLPFAIVSPDGRHLAIANDDEGQIWLRDLDSTVARPLPGTEGARAVFWSPDSRYIAFTSGRKLHKLFLSGGSPETVCEVLAGYPAGSWGNRGNILFTVAENPGNEGIYVVSAQGGTPRKLILRDESGAELESYWPHFLPDGLHFLFIGRRLGWEQQRPGSGSGYERKIYIGDVASEKSRPLRLTNSRAEYAPPGYLLFIQEGTLFAQPFDMDKLRMAGDATPIAERVRFHEPTAFAAFSSSQNGVIAYRTGGEQVRLVWFDRMGKELEEAAERGEYDTIHFRLAPDARRLAVAATDPVTGTLAEDIWIIDLARKTGLRFTTNPGDEFAPIWSPDGRRIVFSADWKAVPNLYEQKVESDTAETLLAPTGTVQAATDWSRDGRWILFHQRDPGGTLDLWALPLFGERKPIQITRTPFFSEYHARFSPDARWIAYQSDESGRWEIYLQAFQGSGEKRRVSVNGGSQPCWRADGKELFYLSSDSKLVAVAVQPGADLSLGDSHSLFLPKANVLGYEASPDGQRFLIATSAGTPAQSTIIMNWPAELKGR